MIALNKTLDDKRIVNDIRVLAIDLGDTSTFTVNRKELSITDKKKHIFQKIHSSKWCTGYNQKLVKQERQWLISI